MRFLFLTREPGLYSMRRFQQACQAEGHAFETLDILACNLVLHPKDPQIWCAGDPVGREDVDVVVPRIGTTVTEVGCAVVNQFEVMGVPVINTARAIQHARDKLLSLQLLTRANVDLPRTAVIRSTEDLDEAIEQVGGIPCVLKLLKGTQGIGVMLAESREGLESILQAFWSLDHIVLLQEFIAESKGKDVRAFVVGDKVVGAMRREAKIGEFRSNIHRGGTGTGIKLSREVEEHVLAATRALGLQVGGVDYLESKEGPKVIEVNASPGFQGLEQATGKDIAAEVVRYAARSAKELRR
ncbi:MAG TPA: RimK family alpha-L-glutamate ligase [Candidatus Thermoplasmatota archaeon]|nr:RimK family alpha-L-glutamate ligase [Candidatus Thermoplasmatota archaeon]